MRNVERMSEASNEDEETMEDKSAVTVKRTLKRAGMRKVTRQTKRQLNRTNGEINENT